MADMTDSNTEIKTPDFVDLMPLSSCSGKCGYFNNRLCTSIYTFRNWIEKELKDNGLEKDVVPITRIYSDYKKKGFCRFNDQFYFNKCYGCKECQAIRVLADEFVPSKGQRKVWRKNQDVEVSIVTEPECFVSDEKAFLFREYDYYHNKAEGKKKKTMDEAREDLKLMNSGYDGIWNMEYKLNGRLIGVGIIDYTSDKYGNIDGIASNYFYYCVEPEILKRSIGVFSVLQEIALCKKLGVTYYYLGLYLQNCRKMNYKTNYRPFELFYDNSWHAMEECTGALRGRNMERSAPLEGVAEDGTEAETEQSEGGNGVSAGDRGGLSPHKVIALPPAESFYNYDGLCFITSEIELDVLYSAYMQGMFPWFNEDEGEPVLWQSPNPRFVIFPERLHVPKSVDKFLKHTPFTYTKDKCFDRVMEQCRIMERDGQKGSWIGRKMQKAYGQFHKAGFAHSYEVWLDDNLAGGFYGVELGQIFFGESMFTIESNSAKSAFVLFAREFFSGGGKLIDCQAYTDNMARFGAVEISRKEFLALEKKYLPKE